MPYALLTRGVHLSAFPPIQTLPILLTHSSTHTIHANIYKREKEREGDGDEIRQLIATEQGLGSDTGSTLHPFVSIIYVRHVPERISLSPFCKSHVSRMLDH